MKKWQVTYSPDKEQRLTTTVEAEDYTKAYLAFMSTHERSSDMPEDSRHKGLAKRTGDDGEIVDVMYSNANDCYVYKIHFDGFDRASNTDFPESSFDLISELDKPKYEYEFDYLNNVVAARLYEIDGDKKTEIGRGHGHIIHSGAFGVAQAASCALKRIAMDLNDGYIDSRVKEGEENVG